MTGALDLLAGGPLGCWAVTIAPPALVRQVVCVDDRLAAIAADLGHDVFAGSPEDPAFEPAPAALAIHFPRILGPQVLRSYDGAIWGVHPGLLPHGRGTHPVFWALWEGTPAGATLHELTANPSEGAIVDRVEVAVFPADTGASLCERVRAAERDLVVGWLPRLASGERPPAVAQPPGGTRHALAEFEYLRDEGRFEVPRSERERLERCLTFATPAPIAAPQAR